MSEDSKAKLVGPNAFTEANFLFNVCWDLDVNSQTMWPPSDHSARHPLPPPQIDPQIEWMLKFLRMTVPDLNWLRTSYPGLSLPPIGSVDNQEENRAKSSKGRERMGQFPSSSNGLQNGAVASNSMTTPALVMPGAKKEDVGVSWDSEKSELTVAGVEPTAVIHDELVYIFGEPMPQYPHPHADWQGPSYVITGTKYHKMEDHPLCQMSSQMPPETRMWMAGAKEATDR